MSLNSISPMKPIAVFPPTINFTTDAQEDYVDVIKSPASMTINSYMPSSGNSSDSEVTFQIYSPNRNNVALSRCVLVNAKVVVKFNYVMNGNGGIPFQPVTALLAQGFGLTANPFAEALSTVTVTIDGVSQTVNMSEWYSYLKYYNFVESDLEKWNTTSVTLLDNSVLYKQGDYSNVLSTFSNASYDSIMPRGGYKLSSYKYAPGSTTANGSVELTYDISEPIPISPFLATQNYQNFGAGFIGFSTMTVKFNFNSDLFNRCFKLNLYGSTNLDTTNPLKSSTDYVYTNNNTAGVLLEPSLSYVSNFFTANNDGTGIITDKSLLFDKITLGLSFYQLDSTTVPPPVNNYPYSNIQPITQTLGAFTEAATTNGVLTPSKNEVVSTSYQLSTIPHRVCHFVCPANDNVAIKLFGTNDHKVPPYSRAKFCLPISKVSILMGNVTGILSSATPNDLYQYSLRNGLSYINYSQSGMGSGLIVSGINANGAATGGQVVGGIQLAPPIGCPIMLGFGTEITFGGDPTLAPGVLSNSLYQATFEVLNYFTVPIETKLVTVFIYEGCLTISSSSNSAFLYGFISRQDVIESIANGSMGLNELPDVMTYSGSGRSLMSGLRKAANAALKIVKNPTFRKVLDTSFQIGDTLGIPQMNNARRITNAALGAIDKVSGNAMMAGVQNGGMLLSQNQIRGNAMMAGGATLSARELRNRLTK